MSTPSNITGLPGPINWSAIVATDAVDGNLSAVCVPPSGTTFDNVSVPSNVSVQPCCLAAMLLQLQLVSWVAAELS